MKSFKIIEIKEFVKLCLPLAISFLAQKGMQFIDTLMMGWIGPEALAAGALGTSVLMTILVFCRGTLSAVGVAIVHARGANQGHEIKLLLHQAFYLALGLALPSMLICWEAPRFLLMSGENARVIENTRQLLQGLTWGIPGFLFFFVLREFVSAFALARIVMLVCSISLPLTFAVNYVLIYGKYGFPTMGVAGIGYGGAVIMWFMFLSILFYCAKQSVLKEHLSFKLAAVQFKKIKELFSIGVSSGIIWILDAGTFLAAAVMLSKFGVAPLAAYQIAIQCASMAFNFPLAVSIVTALQVGHAVAAKNWAQVKHQAYLGLIVGLAIAAVIALFFIFAPGTIANFFLDGEKEDFKNIYHLAILFLMVSAVFQCFDALQILLVGALRGLKDTFVPMLWSVFCYGAVGLGSAYLLGFYTRLQGIGVWIGIMLGISALSAVLALRFQRMLRSQVSSSFNSFSK